MGTRAHHPALGVRLRSQRGQAFTELALVLFLFFMVITAVMQVVWIGSAQLRCQQAARRAAWHWNFWNNADLQGEGQRQLQAILPGCTGPFPVGGFQQDAGTAFEVHYTVPAIGFFRLVKPSGFRIKARSAVIAYNERPVGNKGLDKLKDWVAKKLQGR
jgi:hypothetical protein